MLFHEEIVFHIGHNSFTMLVFEDWIQSGSFTCAQRALHTSTVDEQHLRWQNIIRFGRRKPREASERKQEIVKDILRESRSVQHAASSPSECHLLNAQSSGRENYLITLISRPLRAPPRGGECARNLANPALESEVALPGIFSFVGGFCGSLREIQILF